jgi:hypothetical protein
MVSATCSSTTEDVPQDCASAAPSESNSESAPEPSCRALPAKLPDGVVIDYSRHDREHETIHDYAFVADAPCPEPHPLGLPTPECVRGSRETIQLMWDRLRELEVHRIEMVEHGECPHCAGPWLVVEWPEGRCSAGIGYKWDISDDSQDRFYEMASYMDGVSERVKARARRAE